MNNITLIEFNDNNNDNDNDNNPNIMKIQEMKAYKKLESYAYRTIQELFLYHSDIKQKIYDWNTRHYSWIYMEEKKRDYLEMERNRFYINNYCFIVAEFPRGIKDKNGKVILLPNINILLKLLNKNIKNNKEIMEKLRKKYNKPIVNVTFYATYIDTAWRIFSGDIQKHYAVKCSVKI